MIERRAIIFLEHEILNSLRDYGHNIGKELPNLVPKEITFDLEQEPAIALCFPPNTPDTPEEAEGNTVTFSKDEIIQALLAYCHDQKIPLPEDASSRLSRHKDGAALLLESGAAGMHVMVIDSQEKMRIIIRKLLVKVAPAQVTEASDGASAVYMLLSEGVKPDLIICGPQLHAADMIDFVRLVRSDPSRYSSHTPILVLGAGKSEKDCEVLRREGASMIVSKPVSAADIDTLIKRLCGHWRMEH